MAKNVKNDEEIKVISKHKQSGKHKLGYDSIFKGKKDGVTEENDTSFIGNIESFQIDPASASGNDIINNEDYVRNKKLKEEVYEVLLKNTNINFLNNRRKPSKNDFNHYYFLLKNKIKDNTFSNIELFNELAFYFSDNLFNMFKLLDKKWRNLIINELQEHIGKIENNKDVTHKNLTVGSEIEFKSEDPITGELLLITGVIESKGDIKYNINSYENMYTISIDDITKILNNTKFKYNLNKLNNIDFL